MLLRHMVVHDKIFGVAWDNKNIKPKTNCFRGWMHTLIARRRSSSILGVSKHCGGWKSKTIYVFHPLNLMCAGLVVWSHVPSVWILNIPFLYQEWYHLVYTTIVIVGNFFGCLFLCVSLKIDIDISTWLLLSYSIQPLLFCYQGGLLVLELSQLNGSSYIP